MNLRLKNIVFILFAVTLVFATKAKAQSDTIPESYFTRFQENVAQLSDLYFFSDPEFYSGKYKSEPVDDFSDKYKSLNLSVFPNVLRKSEEYFRFFVSLSEKEKENLVHLFSYYEKDFDTILKKENLPAELKYLAPAISAMNIYAVGKEREAGIWQLTHFQAVLNGGEVTRLVDERMNILRSTQLVTLQLKQNLKIYNDLGLAAIAFLCGNTTVKNALSETGENAKSNVVLKMLPESVSEQVAAFQAMAVFLNTNRFIPESLPFQNKIQDTVLVYRRLHFKQIEKIIGIPVTQIQALNPQYKYSIVPESEKGSKLVLPQGKKDDFVLWNDSINNASDSSYFQLITQKIEYPPAPERQYLGEPVKDLEIEGKTKIKYRLKTGDVLGIIAEDYDVRVADLKYWNNIFNERRIQAGQMIDIFVPDDQVDYYRNLEKQLGEKNVAEKFQNGSQLNIYSKFDTSKKIEHVVKSGESPFTIAKLYRGVTPELILEWNNIDNPRKIQIGQKLIIYPQK